MDSLAVMIRQEILSIDPVDVPRPLVVVDVIYAATARLSCLKHCCDRFLPTWSMPQPRGLELHLVKVKFKMS